MGNIPSEVVCEYANIHDVLFSTSILNTKYYNAMLSLKKREVRCRILSTYQDYLIADDIKTCSRHCKYVYENDVKLFCTICRERHELIFAKICVICDLSNCEDSLNQ